MIAFVLVELIAPRVKLLPARVKVGVLLAPKLKAEVLAEKAEAFAEAKVTVP